MQCCHWKPVGPLGGGGCGRKYPELAGSKAGCASVSSGNEQIPAVVLHLHILSHKMHVLHLKEILDSNVCVKGFEPQIKGTVENSR